MVSKLLWIGAGWCYPHPSGLRNGTSNNIRGNDSHRPTNNDHKTTTKLCRETVCTLYGMDFMQHYMVSISRMAQVSWSTVNNTLPPSLFAEVISRYLPLFSSQGFFICCGKSDHTSRLKHNVRHFADSSLKCILFKQMYTLWLNFRSLLVRFKLA